VLIIGVYKIYFSCGLLLFWLLSIASFAQNTTEVSAFGEGLLLQHPSGGIGGRLTVQVTHMVDLEGEIAREFHSEAFTTTPGKKFYTTGYNFLAGPRLCVSLPNLNVFATAKGGLLHSTTYSEDMTPSSLPQASSGAFYLGGGAEIGDAFGLRVDAGDLLLVNSDFRRNNVRVTAGVFFRF